LLVPELDVGAARAATGVFANHELPCRSVVADTVNGTSSIRTGNAIEPQKSRFRRTGCSRSDLYRTSSIARDIERLSSYR
jgi:hypothetical protein